jgi:uncharacterized protein
VNDRPVYLDTSALVKLVVPEAETTGLIEWLAEWPDCVTSSLGRVELERVLRRGKAGAAVRARLASVIEGMAIVRLDDVVLNTASSLRDPLLRTLDALHLATALSLGDLPEAFVTYDARLAQAARRANLHVVSPG